MCDLFIDTHLLLVEHLYQGCEQISCVNFDPKIVKKKKKKSNKYSSGLEVNRKKDF